MKYYIILLAIFSVSLSCKTKKPIVQAKTIVNAVTEAKNDTIYIENPETGEVTMQIASSNQNINGNWTLQSINGVVHPEMSRVTMMLNISENEKTISGNDACNQYSGTVKVLDEKNIEFSPMVSTKRACMIPAKFAQEYYNALSQIRTYSTTADYLILRNIDGAPSLQFLRND